jgi:hypothetical protein
MKKFFLVLAAIITAIMIAALTAYLFSGIMASIANGILIVIAFQIFVSRWKKATHEKECNELLKFTKTMLTTKAAERKELIEKESLTWHDMCTISNGIGSILQIIDLREVFVGKQMPSFANLISVSDLKKQITWTGFVNDMLKDINRLVDKAYDDEVIAILVGLIKDFEDFLATKSDYYGTELLIKCIQENTPLIQKLIKNNSELL